MTVEPVAKPPLRMPPTLPALRGDERFLGIDASVLDFWRFAISDLRVNLLRGWFAEFLVSRALGLDAVRVEWDNVDVAWGDVKIEVKSSAYVQAWPQYGPSKPSFGGFTAKEIFEDGSYSDEASFKAHVYVLALNPAPEHSLNDQLDVSGWEFYVLPRTVLANKGDRSIGLNPLRKLVAPVRITALRDAVAAAAQAEGVAPPTS